MAGTYGWSIQGVDASQEFIEEESDSPSRTPPNIIPQHVPQGHFWCDYNGDIPHGAIKAGVDKDGGELYVGRAIHNGEILPAKVVPNQNAAFVAYGGEEHGKNEFEILCRGNRNVVWQECSDGIVPPQAVAVGSTAEGERLYIGRAFHDGTLTPGKIHPSHNTCYIPYGGLEISYPNYEVLLLM